MMSATANSNELLLERNSNELNDHGTNKENISFGRDSLVTIDDDKNMLESAHQQVRTAMPSELKFPPPPPLLMPTEGRNDSLTNLARYGTERRSMTVAHKSVSLLATALLANDQPRKLPGHRARGSSRETLFPSLELDLNEEADILPKLPSASTARHSIPQLCIRPKSKQGSKEDLKMPSPLARRGASERAYLEGQLRAEALRRRRQEQQNEERKFRWKRDMATMGGCSDDDLSSDEGILTMLEKFKFGIEGMGSSKPLPKNRRQQVRDLDASPPAILKTTFKRSVSAVLEDSGIDDDVNVLFFPDGVPLGSLRDVDKVFLDDVIDGTSNDSDSRESFHEKCCLSKDDDRSVDSSRSGSISNDSILDELSPSQIPADVIWQLGAFDHDNVPGELSMPTNKGNKKVTLRPKMNAHDNNITDDMPHTGRQFKPIDSAESSHSIPFHAESRIASRASDYSSTNLLSSKEEMNIFKFETPDKLFFPVESDIMAASDSFQKLSFEVDDKMAGAHSDRSCSTHEGDSGNKLPFIFSSPEAFILKGKVSIPPRGPNNFPTESPVDLSESNYWTPDNSEHRRCVRKQVGKMPRLPELSMPDMDLNAQTRFQGHASLALDASIEEEKMFSTDTIESGTLLKEPLSESNFITPENSFNDRRTFRKHISDRIPKLPDLSLPTMVGDSPLSENLKKGNVCWQVSSEMGSELVIDPQYDSHSNMHHKETMKTPC